MSKHTPGPWKVSVSPYSNRVFLIDSEKTGGAIGELIYADIRKAADARLIGAAPDLLRAAKDFVEWFECGRIGEKPIAELHHARAAIAKATGYREHITDGGPCWCNPETTYTDPDTGASVIVHKEPQ